MCKKDNLNLEKSCNDPNHLRGSPLHGDDPSMSDVVITILQIP